MERTTDMKKKSWHITIVDVLVGVAILMILSALIVPVFLPPDGRAAARVNVPAAAARSAKR